MMMTWLFRILRRNKPLSTDARNIVMSIGNAKKLYKELVVIAHPDRNPNNQAAAIEITKLLNENRRDYDMLLSLKQRIETEL